MNAILCSGLRRALIGSLLGLPFFGWSGPQSTAVFAPVPPALPPPEATVNPFPPSSSLLRPSIAESQLTFGAFVEPVAVAAGETATVTLVLSTSIKSEVLISAVLPEGLRVEAPDLDWAVDSGGRHWAIRLDPIADAPMTLTLPLRVEGEIDTVFRIDWEARQGERRIPAAVEIGRVHPGRARIGEAGGLLLFPDRQAWVRVSAPNPVNAEVPRRGDAEAVNADPLITGTVVRDTPGSLPYSLDRIYAVQGPAFEAAMLTVAVPVTADLESATLFRYDPASGRWQRFPTRRTFRGDAVELSTAIHGPGIYAAALSTRSEIGNYEQPWAPTLTEGQVDLFTGGVSWSYPIELPPGRAGQEPAIALNYHSGLVDALRDELNPQASWVGWGWNLDMGYIAVKIDPEGRAAPRSTQEFFLVLNGVSSRLVPIGFDQYRTEGERFWRIERKPTPTNRAHNYWLVTTTDGTQYRFGYQDELAGGDSRESAWWMVAAEGDAADADIVNWRWNLDQIRDVRGNEVRLDYRVERNNFRLQRGADRYYYSDTDPCGGGGECVNGSFRDHWTANTGYIRGGSLEQITYSWPQAAHKIVFEVEGRTDYPAAFDSRDSGVQPVQTFWSRERLRAIAVWSNGQRELVRRYELQWDTGDSRLLQRIQMVATDGNRLPGPAFSYLRLPGYREGCREDGAEGGWKPWLIGIENGYGGGIRLNYTAPENLPWYQNGQIQGPQEDGRCWYRYRVRETTVDPRVGPAIRTIYEYRQAEGDAPHEGSWQGDDFRGHPRVRVRQREADGRPGAYTDVWFFQGMVGPAQSVCGGDSGDSAGLVGREYRRVRYDAAGTALAQQTRRWLDRDLGNGRYFAAPAATCDYPNGGEGPYRRVDYIYDDFGNLIREYRYGDALRSDDEVVLENRYIYNHLAWIMDRVSESRVIAADGLVELQLRTAYDGQSYGAPPVYGLPTQVQQGLERWGWVTATTQYDGWGNVAATVDALGRISRTAYDPAFSLYPASAANALDQVERWSWDQRLNVMTEAVDANGARQRLLHDGFGRLTGVIPPGQDHPAVKYEYPAGFPISAPWGVLAATRIDPYRPAPEYRREWTFYDGLKRVIQTQQETEDGWLVVQSTAYDAEGRVAAVTAPYTAAAAGGVYQMPAWATLPQTRTCYDALGRVVEVIEPGNRITRYAYRDWSRLVMDANGHQRRYDRDGLGRLVAVYEYPGQYAAPDWNAAMPAVTRYWYDARDHPIAIRDALGNVTRFQYDPLGRRIGMDDPSLGHWEYRYDAVGNLIEQLDAEGTRLDYTYDPLNRLIRKTARAGGPGGPETAAVLAEYGYDEGVNGIGRRTTMIDPIGTTRWMYDPEGRVEGEIRIIGKEMFATWWTYAAAGQVVSQTLPTGEIVEWAYNRRGLPRQLRSRTYGQDYLRSAAYEAQGRPLVQEWGNGRVTRFFYGADLRLRQLQLSGGWLDFRYEYDAVGNITTIADAANGGQLQRFGYDAGDRLIRAETECAGGGAYQERYQYDALGRIVVRTVDGEGQTYAYGRVPAPLPVIVPGASPYRLYFPLAAYRCGGEMPCDATLTQPFAVVGNSAGFSAAYDRNGAMIFRVAIEAGRRITYTLTYNAENRLTAITDTVVHSVTRYLYDGNGERVLTVRQAGEGTPVTILHLGDVEFENSAAGPVTRTTYRIGGTPVAVREQTREGNRLVFLHGDHLGSISLATGGDGLPVGRQRYRPFGGGRVDEGEIPGDYRFTGRRDAGMGLYDDRTRFYDPALGRFIQADRVIPQPDDPQTLNRYAYARNNPLRYVDPGGLGAGEPEVLDWDPLIYIFLFGSISE